MKERQACSTAGTLRLGLRLRSLRAIVELWRDLNQGAPGPAVLINELYVAPADSERFVKHWSEIAARLSTCPGFSGSWLHQAVGHPELWMNYASWSSQAALRQALRTSAFRVLVRALPAIAVPRLFRIAVSLQPRSAACQLFG